MSEEFTSELSNWHVCLAAAVGGGPATAVAPFQHRVISVFPVFPAAWRVAAVAVLGVESLQSWQLPEQSRNIPSLPVRSNGMLLE